MIKFNDFNLRGTKLYLHQWYCEKNMFTLPSSRKEFVWNVNLSVVLISFATYVALGRYSLLLTHLPLLRRLSSDDSPTSDAFTSSEDSLLIICLPASDTLTFPDFSLLRCPPPLMPSPPQRPLPSSDQGRHLRGAGGFRPQGKSKKKKRKKKRKKREKKKKKRKKKRRDYE